jgi:hypothetical protein
MTLAPGVSAIKLFSLLLLLPTNKLECLSFARLFVNKLRGNYTMLNRLARVKQTSLFWG